MLAVAFPDPHRLGFFVAAALVLLLIPGPAVLYVVAQSLEQGVAVSLLIRAVGTVMQIVLGLLAGGGSLLFSGREQLERERDQELDAVPGASSALAATRK